MPYIIRPKDKEIHGIERVLFFQLALNSTRQVEIALRRGYIHCGTENKLSKIMNRLHPKKTYPPVRMIV